MSKDDRELIEGEALARRFHETYERLAPSFGYETRADTKAFDPATPNGQLMIAVCSELSATRLEALQAQPVGERVEETGWLIEYGPSSPTAPRYWGGVRGWTYDHMEAVRFSRQVDAQSIAESMDDGVPGNYRLAEHAWSSAALTASPPVVEREALERIAAERERQISAEGWTPEHDDKHPRGELALAAALYASPIELYDVHVSASGATWSDPWPWFRMDYHGRAQAGDPPTEKVLEGDGRKKHDRRRRLVIAGALIVAEIERLDRATLSKGARHAG